MGFLMYCDNKGCCKEQEPVLDIQTNEVFCTECDKTIANVTSFAKTQMKTLGQTKKNTKAKQAFAVRCETCQKEATPTVDRNDVAHCSLCKAKISNLAKPFIQMIKNISKK